MSAAVLTFATIIIILIELNVINRLVHSIAMDLHKENAWIFILIILGSSLMSAIDHKGNVVSLWRSALRIYFVVLATLSLLLVPFYIWMEVK